MAGINREFLFSQARSSLFGGSLRKAQVQGISAILDEWERASARQDDRWLAYMLATTHHETDRTMQPIREYGRGKGRKYGVPDLASGHVYYGRGFVQLTWKFNYEAMSKLLKADLVAAPDRALELPIATQILFEGMRRGTFTGKKLADYFDPATEDWRGARRIINGLDKADAIADYGRRYYAAISYTV